MNQRSFEQPIFWIINGLLIVLMGVLLWGLGNFHIETLFEHTFYDACIRNGSTHAPPSAIVIIESTPADVERFRGRKTDENENLDIPLHIWSRVINVALNAKAQTIGFNLNPLFHPFSDPNYHHIDSLLNRSDGIIIGTTSNWEGLHIPDAINQEENFGLHTFAAYHSSDPVRATVVNQHGKKKQLPSFGQLVFEHFSGKSYKLAVAPYLTPLPKPFHRQDGFYFYYSNNRTFKRYTVSDVLSSGFNTEQLRNKLVLMGANLDTIFADGETSATHLTPLSKDDRQRFSKTHIWAYAIDNVLEKTAIIPLSKLIKYLSALLVVMLVYICMTRFSLLTGTLLSFVTVGLVAFVSAHLLIEEQQWLKVSTSAFFAFLTFFVTVFYRALSEIDSSWSLQATYERDTKLSNVQTEFVSLLTSNLKTAGQTINEHARTCFTEIEKNQFDDNHIATKAAQQLTQTANDFHHYIASIINLANIESLPQQVAFSDIRLTPLLARLIERTRFRADEKLITFDVEIDPTLTAKSDENILDQVISNILTNAVKYAPAQSHIRICVSRKRSLIIFAVSDQGPGIPDAFKSLIFSKFYRIKNNQVYATSGTGLGLYLVKYLLAIIGGTVSVQNNKTVGCTFTIIFPVRPSFTATWSTYLRQFKDGLIQRYDQLKLRARTIVKQKVDRKKR